MDNFIIITGGPGSGKTTLIEALARLGHGRSVEAGRAITRAQFAIGGNAHHLGDRKLYAELMLVHEIRSYEEARDRPGLTFFDRGVPELGRYMTMSGLATPPHFVRATELYRYNRTVFGAPPWREIYVNDAERKQDFAEAVDSYAHCVEAYRGNGYHVVDLPRADVEERLEFVLQQVVK